MGDGRDYPLFSSPALAALCLVWGAPAWTGAASFAHWWGEGLPWALPAERQAGGSSRRRSGAFWPSWGQKLKASQPQMLFLTHQSHGAKSLHPTCNVGHSSTVAWPRPGLFNKTLVLNSGFFPLWLMVVTARLWGQRRKCLPSPLSHRARKRQRRGRGEKALLFAGIQ